MALSSPRKVGLWIVPGLLLGASGGGCSSGRAASVPGAQGRVEKRSLDDLFLLTGEIRAASGAQLRAPVLPQPQIRWIEEDGASVRAGDRVLEFDSAAVLANLEELRTKVLQSGIQLESKEREVAAEAEKRRSAFEKAEVEAEKARVDAVVPQELRSSLEWRKMQTTLLERETAREKARLDREAFAVTARTELLSLQGELQKARRALEVAEESVRSASVAAPADGIFVVGKHWRRDEDRKFQAGDNVWPGFPVAEIPDSASLEVDARLSEVDHGRIEAGMEARVVVDTFPDRVFAGKVAEVASVADESRERPGFAVRVVLEAADPALMRPGLSVRVEVVRGRYGDALTVPRAAVRFDEGRPVVEAPGRDAAEIQLGACTPLDCLVRSGLREGDLVRLF
ncbi:MAG TPA: efflux RND transporter periplasmic adaptor subunit [Vicinamibacteria bacterium]